MSRWTADDWRRRARCPKYSPLDAFMQEHRRCGELDGGVDRDHLWIVCDCGGGIAHPIRPPRPVPPKDYDRSKEYDRF